MNYKNLINKEVRIHWDDSNGYHGWISKELVDTNIAHCRSWGLLIAETEESLTIVFGDSDCGSVMNSLAIPKSCIKSVKELH